MTKSLAESTDTAAEAEWSAVDRHRDNTSLPMSVAADATGRHKACGTVLVSDVSVLKMKMSWAIAP